MGSNGRRLSRSSATWHSAEHRRGSSSTPSRWTHIIPFPYSPRVAAKWLRLFSDITDRKQYEQQLEALNTSVQNLLAAEARKEVAEVATETARDVLGLDANGVHLYDEGAGGLVPVTLTDSAKRPGDSPATFTPGDSIAWRTYEQGDVTAVDDVRADPDTYDPETDFRSAIYMPLGEHGILLAGSTDVAAFDTRTETLARIFAKNVTTALEQVDQNQQLRRERRTIERQNERLEEFAGVEPRKMELNPAERPVFTLDTPPQLLVTVGGS